MLMGIARQRWTMIVGYAVLLRLLPAGDSVPGAWTSIGPSPASITAPIIVDPRGSGNIFVGLVAGGVRRSTDNGVTWSTVNVGLIDLRIEALSMDASGAQTVYAGAFGGGLFKTIDGGLTWQNLPAISGSILCVATDSSRAGVVYVAVFQNLTNGSIRKSADGGATWSTVFSTTAPIFTITVDPINSDVLYAPTIGHGAFKSTDGGLHWSLMSALTPSAIWAIAADPANTQVLYAGTNDDGVWKSVDGGATWHGVGSPGSVPVYSLTVSGTNTLYAGTDGGGVWQSADGGLTWYSTGLSTGIVLSVKDLLGTLYAGTGSAGALVSRDRGATWTDLDPEIANTNKFAYGLWINPSNGRKIFASSPGEYGLISSKNGGATWSEAGRGFTARGSRHVAFDPSNPLRIYAGGTVGDGLFKSEDGGITWTRHRFGSAAVNVIPVAVDSLSPNIVYAGTQNEGAFKSTDYGETWKAAGAGLSGAITNLTVDPFNAGRLFAATATAFFLSDDGGETWTNVLNKPAWTITIASSVPSTLFATTRTQGVFRSMDGGHSWEDINTGLTSLTMGRNAPVIVDPTDPQTLYVASEGGGVFQSRDGGDHWFTINRGLEDLSVYGLALAADSPKTLYACGPSGAYKRVIAGKGTVRRAPEKAIIEEGQ